MSTLTPAQVYRLATDAGFNPATAALMVGIAGGESGLRTDAVGDVGLQDSTWGPSIGLWQIRSLKADTGTGRPRDASRLKDPAFNARSARSVYGSQGLNAWTVYSNASEATRNAWRTRDYGGGAGGLGGGLVGGLVGGLPGAVVGATSDVVPKVGGAVVDAAGGVLSGLDAVGGFFGQLGQRGTWVRVLQVLGGVALVVGGVSIVGRGVIGEVATSIIPGGAAVKAAAGVVT